MTLSKSNNWKLQPKDLFAMGPIVPVLVIPDFPILRSSRSIFPVALRSSDSNVDVYGDNLYNIAARPRLRLGLIASLSIVFYNCTIYPMHTNTRVCNYANRGEICVLRDIVYKWTDLGHAFLSTLPCSNWHGKHKKSLNNKEPICRKYLRPLTSPCCSYWQISGEESEIAQIASATGEPSTRSPPEFPIYKADSF